ncbi:hypothetical protein ACEWY4_018086 [Coilia grayii]|uniref:Ig-like domain-containing protein n=1 Tax=Coilia grayii TaxID=363190 RepID=A0ABD1JIY9_9TELE
MNHFCLGILSDCLQVTVDHEVTYNSQSICGLKGSSVVMTCSYTPPTNQTVSSVFWFSPKQRHHWWGEDQPEDLLLDSDYMGRVKYTGTEGRSSTLTITDLRLGDSGVYHCLYVSNEGRYSDLTGVNITVTGSSVELSSSYTYPRGLTVTHTFWHDKEKQNLDIVKMENFKGRGEYRNTTDHFNLSIRDVRERDAGEYRFRFIADTGFSGKPGVILNVTGLQVKTSAHNVTEGQDVTLTCSTSCSLSNNPTFVWYKNGQPVTNRHVRKNNKLYLISLNTEDHGNYSCGVKGHNLISSAVTLYITGVASETHTGVYASAGVIILLTVSLLCAVLWIRKRRRNNLSERTESTGGEGRATSTPVCSNDSSQAVDTDDDNNVQYSSLQFGQRNKQNNKHQQRQGEDSDVLYASVRVPLTGLS